MGLVYNTGERQNNIFTNWEFDSKVLIAINSVKNGATAVVSTRGFVNNLKNKPNGVVLAKSAARFEIET